MSNKKQGPYKPTGILPVDMVAACIFHCERHGKTIEYIRLRKPLWIIFVGFVKEKIPGYDLSDGYVDFDGVKVTEGSSLMVKDLYYELAKPNMIILN